MAKMRRNLSLPGMLSDIRREFSRISDEKSRRSGIKLFDCLMSGLAVFSLKYPSLLQFDREHNAEMRLLSKLRREHPRLKAIVVEDSLPLYE